MKKADLVISSLLMAVSIYIFYETSSYPEPLIEGAPGASLFPNVLALCLVILSVILFINGFLHKKVIEETTNWKMVGKVGIDLVLIIIFLIFLDIWDVFIMMPLLLGATMIIMGEKSIKAIIAVPLIFDLFVYAVFYKMFNVMLPTIYF
ncbi:MAG: tripartite tricarboxylate transporter TctB family protein [Deltaproteobacteria bacterium]|nr:tripartite tricarboxylate transporter TctB family protein [Deltaproteobacteria bacterium]